MSRSFSGIHVEPQNRILLSLEASKDLDSSKNERKKSTQRRDMGGSNEPRCREDHFNI